jgi:hypothetical protein
VALGVGEDPTRDYMQNGSTTPRGNPSGDKRLGADDGTNYNCLSDTTIIGNCPDLGVKLDDTYQVPNVIPGGAEGD